MTPWPYLLAGFGLGVAAPFAALMGLVAVDWLKARSASRRNLPSQPSKADEWAGRKAVAERMRAAKQT